MLTTTLKLTDQKVRILYAALIELDTRLSRGLANSDLDKRTIHALYNPNHIHESYVSELRRELMLHVGGGSL